MSTHAKYFLWAGVWTDAVTSNTAVPDRFERFLDELDRAHEEVEIEGTKITAVQRHGETVGYGYVIETIDWQTSEEEPHEPRAHEPERLELIRRAVQLLLRGRGLPDEVPVKLYHHLDLGG